MWNLFVFSYKLIFLIEHKVLSKLNVVIAIFRIAHPQGLCYNILGIL